MGMSTASAGLFAPTERAYSTERPALRLVPPRSEPVLSPQDSLALKSFFCEFEAHALGANTGGVVGESGITGYDGGQVRLVDLHITRDANLVRERLLRMVSAGQTGLIVALYRMHGPKPPGVPYAEFRDLAPLAEITDAAEAARLEMGRKGGIVRAAEVEEASEAERARRLEDAERTFWEGAGEIAKLDVRLADPVVSGASHLPSVVAFWRSAGELDKIDRNLDALTDEGLRERLEERRYARWSSMDRLLTEALGDLAARAARKTEAIAARRDAWRAVLASALAVVQDPAAVVERATETARHAPTRELSAGDVLRAQLTYRGKADAKGKADKDAHAAWVVQRSAFVARVRNEAEKLRVESALAFAASRWP